LKTLRYLHKAPIRVVSMQKRLLILRTKRIMIKLKIALAQERLETTLMLITYRKYTQGLATKEDMKIANGQFVEVLKSLGLGAFAILPFAPITIPLVVKLGHLVGVEVMPTAFRNLGRKKTKSVLQRQDHKE